MTAAPAVAAALLAVRYGSRSVPIVTGVALAASGAVAIGGFWAYYLDPTIGAAFGWLALVSSIAASVWCWWKGDLYRGFLRELRTPLALWTLGSFFIVFFGFLHGGADQAISMSATRFSSQLPSDNDIPRFFAEWFAAHGHNGTPPLYPPSWLMSDRPPLQVGYVLSQRPFSPDTGALHYQVLSVVIQQLWIPAMWAVLCAARLRPTTRSLTMFTAIASDVAIVHGFFVWPKLLAATFLLAGVALVFSPEWTTRLRKDPRAALLLGCLLSLSLLAHGSSVFGVLPLALIAAVRGLPSWRWLGIGSLVGVVLLGSWSAYQHYGDPPGNRLLKWQLGGVAEIDGRGTVEAIVNGYSAEGMSGTLENKRDNFEEMVGLPRMTEVSTGINALESGELGSALGGIRGPRFFSLLPLLGVFLVAPFAMVIARDRGRKKEADWRFALLCFAFVGLGSLAWGLLLFGTIDARTALHVGSLTVPLLALCGCVAGLRATYPRLAIGIAAANVAIVLMTYTPSLTPPPGTSYSPIAAAIAALSLFSIGLTLFRDRTADRLPGAGPITLSAAGAALSGESSTPRSAAESRRPGSPRG